MPIKCPLDGNDEPTEFDAQMVAAWQKLRNNAQDFEKSVELYAKKPTELEPE